MARVSLISTTGGASAAIETIRDYQARMRGHLIELYGMLETGFHSYTRFTDDPQKVNGTIGRVVGDMELRIVDDAYTGHADVEKAVKGLRRDLPTLGLSHIAEEADALWRHGVPLVGRLLDDGARPERPVRVAGRRRHVGSPGPVGSGTHLTPP